MKKYLVALSILFFCASAHGAPRTQPIIGGEFVSTDGSPVAFILTETYRCSGALVGPRVVLTAAHCVDLNIPAAGYGVWISGTWYGVEQAVRHSNFNDSSPIEEVAPFDIGALFLTSQPPVNYLSIVYDDEVRIGETAGAFGFGANEYPDGTFGDPSQFAKSATLGITFTGGGIVYSSLSASNGITCSGDSGGPLLQTVGRYVGQVGLLSFGNTRVDSSGQCGVQGSDADAGFVDLQSSISVEMLNAINAIAPISAISGRLARFEGVALELQAYLRRARNPTTFQQLDRLVTRINRHARSLKSLADARRTSLVRKLSSALNRLRRATTVEGAAAALTQLRRVTQQLVALGVNP